VGNVNAQVLGSNSTRFSVASASSKQALVDALNARQATTIGTRGGSLPYGLYGSHAYSVTGYNAVNDTFSLFNPWGTSHPAPLTWAQIQSSFTSFVIANATQSTPIVASTSGNLRMDFAPEPQSGPMTELTCRGISEFHTFAEPASFVHTSDAEITASSAQPRFFAADAFFAEVDSDETAGETRDAIDLLLEIRELSAEAAGAVHHTWGLS
jgi:hypothetical protein